MSIRPCREDERGAVLEIVNAAAQAYRGVIPDDCWHEPYMSARELDAEIVAGVRFWAYELDGTPLAVMGVQPKADVDLIRHAYVRLLVGTWAAADWAIDFYRRHGFELVTPQRKDELLRMYWDIPDRQIDTSVVLASPPFD
jgi:hypothetical protein